MTTIAPTLKILLVTALPLERDALLRVLTDTSEQEVCGRVVHHGMHNRLPIYVACLNGMGNVNAAARVAELLVELRPTCVIIAGIAGGVKSSTSQLTAKQKILGDILVAEQIVDYELGRQEPEGVQHRYRVFRSSQRLVDHAKELANSQKDWVHDLIKERPDETSGRVNPVVHFGTVGSGEKVIADEIFVDPLKTVWTQLIGIEMEGVGVALACHTAISPPEFILIKAVCDWADISKNDAWQPYAADAAATFTAKLLERAFTHNAPSSQNAVVFSVLPSKKLVFVRRLNNSWRDLADVLQIPIHERGRFIQGEEARAIWEWLEVRQQLSKLSDALSQVDRSDLAHELTTNP